MLLVTKCMYHKIFHCTIALTIFLTELESQQMIVQSLVKHSYIYNEKW